MSLEVLSVRYVSGRGYVLITNLDYSGSLRADDVLEQDGCRWQIVGVEHFRPYVTTTRHPGMGILVKSISALEITPAVGWYNHLGKPRKQ